jgi:hypothetical protein
LLQRRERLGQQAAAVEGVRALERPGRVAGERRGGEGGAGGVELAELEVGDGLGGEGVGVAGQDGEDF